MTCHHISIQEVDHEKQTFAASVGAVVDRRFLLSGGANITRQSEGNDEYCYKMAGPVLRQVLERMSGQRQNGALWQGL